MKIRIIIDADYDPNLTSYSKDLSYEDYKGILKEDEWPPNVEAAAKMDLRDLTSTPAQITYTELRTDNEKYTYLFYDPETGFALSSIIARGTMNANMDIVGLLTKYDADDVKIPTLGSVTVHDAHVTPDDDNE